MVLFARRIIAPPLTLATLDENEEFISVTVELTDAIDAAKEAEFEVNLEERSEPDELEQYRIPYKSA
jgi:hypothetical protein